MGLDPERIERARKNGLNNLGKNKSEEFKKKCSERASGKNNPMYGVHRFGKENPFYGKTHTEKTRKKISEDHLANSQFYSDNVLGSKNPMYGRDLSGSKNGMYGKHISEENRKTLSIKMSGCNNPMYGKPSPQGSGNGWSGWYKEKYFRSILELSTMIYFEKNKIKFELAEKTRIPYIFLNKDRTYSPDFYLPEENLFIECKYHKLLNSPNVKAKTEAAIKHFKNFKILTEKDINILKETEIKNLLDKKLIKWNKFYEKLFKDRFIP